MATGVNVKRTRGGNVKANSLPDFFLSGVCDKARASARPSDKSARVSKEFGFCKRISLPVSGFIQKPKVKLPKSIWLGKRAFTFGHAGGRFPTKTRMKLPVQIFPVKRIYATLERSVSSIRKSGLCQVGNFKSRFYLRVIVLFPR